MLTSLILGYLNDLWRWDSVAKSWTWMAGSSLTGQGGNYGTVLVTLPTNSPGGRYAYGIAFNPKSGMLYIFGGNGVGSYVVLNDLWQWDSGTNFWTWLSGSSSANQVGVFGTQALAASSNRPGARQFSTMVLLPDTGRLLLFGGAGYGASGMHEFYL